MLVFVGGPLLVFLGVLPGHKILWLGAATAGCLLWLIVVQKLSMSQLLRLGPCPDLRGLLLRLVFVAALATALVLLMEPARLFSFPRTRPLFWLVVLLLYPPLSAFPQELIHRAFFFKRYQSLFGTGLGMSLASAAAFSWLHVIYGNVPALLLSLAGGVVLAEVYRRNGSLFWTSVEHAGYGILVFSIGLGRYFYGGPQ